MPAGPPNSGRMLGHHGIHKKFNSLAKGDQEQHLQVLNQYFAFLKSQPAAGFTRWINAQHQNYYWNPALRLK